MMDILDFHTHLAVKLDSFLGLLERNNIEKAVVIPYSFGPYNWKDIFAFLKTETKPEEYIHNVLMKLDEVNNGFLEQLKGHKNLIPAPWISPECNNLDDIFSKPEVKIIKFIPVLDNVTPDYYKKIEYYVENAVDNNKIVMIHTGWGAKVKPVGELASKYPTGKFVIAHMKEDNDFEAQDRLDALMKNPNLYAETSYGPGPHRIEQYVKAGLGKRIIFGSDFRISESSLKWYIAQITFAELDDKIKQDILCYNAKELLNI